MPPAVLLTIGPAHTLEQNLVYALPVRQTKGIVIGTAAVLEQSNEEDFDPLETVAQDADGGFQASAVFIRSTGAEDVSVTLKAV